MMVPLLPVGEPLHGEMDDFSTVSQEEHLWGRVCGRRCIYIFNEAVFKSIFFVSITHQFSNRKCSLYIPRIFDWLQFNRILKSLVVGTLLILC